MKKHLLLLLSCSLLVGEASYASKRLRDPGADKSPQESKRQRTQDDHSLAAPQEAQDLMRLINEKPDYIFENAHVYDAVLEAYYKQEISVLPKFFMRKVLSNAPSSQKSEHPYDIVCFIFSRILGLHRPIRPQTLATLQEHEELGDTHARHMLATFHRLGGTDTNGNIHIRSDAKTYALLLKGALGGHAPSQGDLGYILLKEWVDENYRSHAPDVSRAFDLLTKASKAGHPFAQYHLSRLYTQGWTDNNGTVHKQDFDRKFELLTQASHGGYMSAQHDLADIHAQGWTDNNGTVHAPDRDRARDLYIQAAANGHADAQERLLDWCHKGWIGAHGTPHAPDPDLAFDFLHTWAKGGDVSSQYKLAHMYREGWVGKDGTKHKPNLRQEYYWLDICAKQGHVPAQTEQALLCLEKWYAIGDKSIEYYKTLAFSLFGKAANRGYLLAQYHLGNFYRTPWVDENGVERKKDNGRAFAFLNAAAKGGHIPAQDMLLDCLDNGMEISCNGQMLSPLQAKHEMLSSWAESGNAHGQYKLAKLYLSESAHLNDGNDNLNWEIANQWATLAANQGHVEGQYLLAFLHVHEWNNADGTRHEGNHKERFNLLTMAASQNHLNALEELAQMYWEGCGAGIYTIVEVNQERAIELHKKAAALGSSSSAYFLSSIYKDGDRMNISLALEYASLAADKNNEFAQYDLGMLYLQGHEEGLEPDMDKAIHYLVLSAYNDHGDAIDEVKKLLNYKGTETTLALLQFDFSKGLQERFDDLLPNIQHLIGVTNPHTIHKESMKSDFLHKNLTLVEEDILNLQRFLPSLCTDGFMMSDVDVTFVKNQRAVDFPSLKTFELDRKIYLCAGRENVTAAKAFIPSVKRAQCHPALQKCMGAFEFFKEQWDPSDKESQENCATMVKTLQEMDETLRAVSDEICVNIAKNGNARVHGFFENDF